MPSIPRDDTARYFELNQLLNECEDLMAKPLRGICLGASLFWAAAAAFLISASWGPFSWVDATIAAVNILCGYLIERKSRADWWRDQRDLAETAEKIRYEMRAIARAGVNKRGTDGN